MLARLQVLRVFHIIYVVGVLLAGGFLGRLTRNRLRYAIYFMVLAAIFTGQLLTYPASRTMSNGRASHRATNGSRHFYGFAPIRQKTRSSRWTPATSKILAKTHKAFAS